MAGDGEGERVGGAGSGNGADGFGPTNALGDFGVAGGLAQGDFGERAPDTLLEGGAADVEGEIEGELRVFHEADDAGDDLLEIAVGADQVRPGKAVLEIAGELVGVVSQENGADALVGCGDEDGTERALADGEADGGAGTTLAEGARLHAEGLRGLGIKSSAGIVAGSVNRAGDAFAAGKLAADFFGPARGGVGFGAEAGQLGEDALKVKGA